MHAAHIGKQARVAVGWLRDWALSCLVLSACATGTAARATPPAVNCRIELDRSVLPADAPQTATIKVTLDAPPLRQAERPPVNLAIVLDHSGSMAGAKLEKAKEAAIAALRRLTSRDLFSLVVYDSQVETVVPAQSAANTEWIEARIREIKAGSSTALFGGVSQGAAELRKHLDTAYVQRLILLSDGLANVGPSSPDDLGRLGAALIKEHISVTTIGVGTDYNEDLMARLSRHSDGNIYFVESGADLPRIFAAELGDVLSVAAKRVRLTIECPEGVRPVSLLGRDGRIRGQTVEIFLNQLYGGQEKYALVEVTIPGGRAGERREIATARVTYDDPLTAREVISIAQADARFSGDPAEADRSANLTVQRVIEINLSAQAQDDAIALADQGKREEAAEKLNESAQRLKAKAAVYNDEQLEHIAKDMERSADAVGKEGMDNLKRKELRRNSEQKMNQQQMLQ